MLYIVLYSFQIPGFIQKMGAIWDKEIGRGNIEIGVSVSVVRD